MKGFSFFAAITLALLLAGIALQFPKNPSQSETLLLEKQSFLAKNTRLALAGALSLSLKKNTEDYLSPNPQKRSIAALKITQDLSSFEAAAESFLSSEGFRADLWCGNFDKSALQKTAEISKSQNFPQKCPGCLDLSSPTCLGFLQIDSASKSTTASALGLPPSEYGGFGLTLCSARSNSCTASYLPGDFQVFY